MKIGNISVFIPHIGCPNCCSFCNQNEITGVTHVPGAKDVQRAIEASLQKSGAGVCELAFFGGSFTAIDRAYMQSLLKAAAPYVQNGDILGIRCSTRPDAVDEAVLQTLKHYGVTAIELGAQSMDDGVLKQNFRGHTAQDVVNASSLIHRHHFELGLQMMTDLYTSTEEKDMKTAAAIVALKPKTARIYPTVILKGTYLETLYAAGCYKPMPLDEKVRVAAKIAKLFRQNGIDVIRIGLHASDSIKENALGGTFHDAFGERAASEILFQSIVESYAPGAYDAHIDKRFISKLVGQRRENINRLAERGYSLHIVPDSGVAPGEVRLTEKAVTV